MVLIEMVAAVLTIAFVVLPARGLVGRNAFIGVRTRATMRDDSAWRRGHHAAVLPTSLAAGAVLLVGGGAIVLGKINDVTAVVLCAGLLLGGALWSADAARRAVR